MKEKLSKEALEKTAKEKGTKVGLTAELSDVSCLFATGVFWIWKNLIFALAQCFGISATYAGDITGQWSLPSAGTDLA